jgi:hypothetical protein
VYVWCGRGSLWTWGLFDIYCAVLTYFLGFDFLAVMRRESGDLIHQLPIRLPSLFTSTILFPSFNTRWLAVGTCEDLLLAHSGHMGYSFLLVLSISMGVRLGVHLLLRKHCPI